MILEQFGGGNPTVSRLRMIGCFTGWQDISQKQQEIRANVFLPGHTASDVANPKDE
jgi:hypothetical protein